MRAKVAWETKLPKEGLKPKKQKYISEK
jgi:hypothetical protein